MDIRLSPENYNGRRHFAVHAPPPRTSASAVASAHDDSPEALFNADLERRGISPEQAKRAGLFVTGDASKLYPYPGALPRGIGTVITYFTPDGQRLTFEHAGRILAYGRVRYLQDSPRSFVGQGKKRRYRGPAGSTQRVYFAPGIDWPRILSDPAESLLITEGEFKGLTACNAGFPTIALPGVFGFAPKGAIPGVMLPELDAAQWNGRRVAIVYDTDAIKNRDVLLAERRLSAELTQRGAIVHVIRLPPGGNDEKVGLDDFINTHGPDALIELLNAAVPVDPAASLIVEGTDVEIANAALTRLEDERASPVMFCEGQFHVFTGTHWQPIPEHELRKTIYEFDRVRAGQKGRVKLSDGRARSVLAIMADHAAAPDFFADAFVGINCASGFIQFESDGTPYLEPHDREHRQRHYLPGHWQAAAAWEQAKLLSAYLRGCHGGETDFADRVALTGEVLGAAALGGAAQISAAKAVVLYGPTAGNGKSELLVMARGLLPTDAVSSVPPTRFSDERMLIQLRGKRLNACDELGTTQAIASDTFKSVITGNAVLAKELYRQAVSFTPTAQHIYATNVLPPFHGGFDRGVQRRLIVLTFNRTIPNAEIVANIGARIASEEAGALLAFAVDGAARLLRNGGFTVPPSSHDATREWIFNADPVLAWLENRTEYAQGCALDTKQAYGDFKYWAETEGFKGDRLPTANNFVQRVLNQDGRISKKRNAHGRFIVGVRLLEMGRPMTRQ